VAASRPLTHPFAQGDALVHHVSIGGQDQFTIWLAASDHRLGDASSGRIASVILVAPMLLTPTDDTNESRHHRSNLDALRLPAQVTDSLGHLCGIF
jgi:hypothetical protein